MSRFPAGWIVYGCRTPYAVEAAEVIWRSGGEVRLLVDNLTEGANRTGQEDDIDPVPVIDAPVAGPDDLPAGSSDLASVVPLVTPGLRFAAEAGARSRGLESFPPLIDPTAVVARTATVGEGSLVNAAALIAGDTGIGRFVLVNRGTSIGHHNTIEDYVSFGPGCVLAGQVRVGRGAFVGAGAVCAPKVSIGPNATVGAGAVVVRDVPAEAVAVGNPARVIRSEAGYDGIPVPPGL